MVQILDMGWEDGRKRGNFIGRQETDDDDDDDWGRKGTGETDSCLWGFTTE